MFIPKQHNDFYRKNAYFIIFAVLLVLFYSLHNSISHNQKLNQRVNTELFWNEDHKVASLELPIIIHVYDNFCMYCKRDHQLFAAHPERDQIRIAGLNVSKEFNDMLNFLVANGKLYDANIYPSSAKAVAQLGVDSLPTTIILNENSEIIYYFKGSISEHILTHEIIPKYKEAAGR